MSLYTSTVQLPSGFLWTLWSFSMLLGQGSGFGLGRPPVATVAPERHLQRTASICQQQCANSASGCVRRFTDALVVTVLASAGRYIKYPLTFAPLAPHLRSNATSTVTASRKHISAGKSSNETGHVYDYNSKLLKSRLHDIQHVKLGIPN